MKILHIQDIEDINHQTWAEHLSQAMGKEYVAVTGDELLQLRTSDGFSQWLQDESIDIIVISCEHHRHDVQGFLNASRELRIPYIFLTPVMRLSLCQRILAPVTMLEEEVHKAEILTHFHRYTDSHIFLLQANDYGHRAANNTTKIQQFIQRQTGADDICTIMPAKHNSQSLHRELSEAEQTYQADLIAITASREYGLDDLIFGPAERYVIMHACHPVLLLNPRGDLFSLCD